LLEFIRKYPVEVEILSSSGGEKFHGEVTVQKINWLKKHGIHYKANIVPGRKHKKEYARADTILIDDTEDVIHDFNAAGGHGILHKDISKTKAQLQKLLAKNTK
jgi:predicted ATP-grasp superfamily ATP-dependent carboligase